MQNELNVESMESALRAMISELDYDLHKSIEYPEDPESDDNVTYTDLAVLVIQNYEDDLDYKLDQADA